MTRSLSLDAAVKPILAARRREQSRANGRVSADETRFSDDADRTQAGNAARLVEKFGHHIRYVQRWNEWLVWIGHRWERDERLVRLTEMMKQIGQQRYLDAAAATSDKDRAAVASWARASLAINNIRGSIELARGIPGVVVDYDDLDRDPWIFGVKNGVIELRTGTHRAGRPEDLMTMNAPVNYDGNARAPRWERAMEEWFPDAETRSYVQRLTGSALVGRQEEHIFAIQFGEGRNGKGTFVRAQENVLGPYVVTPHMSLLVHQKHEQHETVKADLFRARLAIASETDKRVALAEASVKNLTGGDRIHCRRLYENSWTFEPSHSLWLLTNYLPEIRGRDRGIWSRIRVIPWMSNFEAAPEKGIDIALRAEAAGILNWLIEGCLLWQRDGLKEPEAVIRATMAYRESEDTLSRFAEDCGLSFTKQLSINVKELNSLFDDWTLAEGLKMSRRDFNQWLKDQGARQDFDRDEHGTRTRIWRHVGRGNLEAQISVRHKRHSTNHNFSINPPHVEVTGGPVPVVPELTTLSPKTDPSRVDLSPEEEAAFLSRVTAQQGAGMTLSREPEGVGAARTFCGYPMQPCPLPGEEFTK